jgi:hypothetical protein
MTNVVPMFSATDTGARSVEVGASLTSLTLTVMFWVSDSEPSDAVSLML